MHPMHFVLCKSYAHVLLSLLLRVLQVQYVPKFFFGALLLWFGVEIVKDWLFESMK